MIPDVGSPDASTSIYALVSLQMLESQDGAGAMGQDLNMFNKPLRPLPDPIITIE
jgi:hypothetical protein